MFHKRLLKEFPENKRKVVGMVLTQWVSLIANVILMLQVASYIGGFVTEDFHETQFFARTQMLLITLLLCLIVRGLMTFLQAKLSFAASRMVKTKLRNMVYEKLMCLGSSYRESFQTSEVVQLSTEGVEQLEIYFGKYIPQFFYSMLAPLTLFFIVGTMSWKVAVILLICVPLIPVSIVAVQKFAKKMLAKYWGTYTQMGDSFLECLQGLTTLKIYEADGRYAKKMDAEAETFRKVTMRVLIMQLNSISIMDLVAYGGAALGVIFSILEYQVLHITLEQCFFIIMISAEFFLPLRLLGSFFHIAMNGNAAADKIFRLIDLPVMKPENAMNEEFSIDEITMENVTFSYEEEKTVLKNISLTAKKGLTAIVGESGCGKSTITSLLMKEHSGSAGHIYMGKCDLERIEAAQLYRKVTRIRHDSYLFAGTIRENLLMGNPAATEKELQETLMKVHMWEFVEAQGGLDYALTEKANNLSGGQRQRIALARALLHDADVYIFDEATSNVDVESENDIMKVVYDLARTKVVLLISHRLANVVFADEIYVLDQGHIVEHGTQQVLMENQGFYHHLYNQQRQLEDFGGAKVPLKEEMHHETEQ